MQGFQMYEGVVLEDFIPSPSCSDTSSSHVLLYSLSVMKAKVQQLQSIVSIIALSPVPMLQPEPSAETIAGAGALIQDITVAASSMMYVLEKMGTATADGCGPCIRNEDILQHYGDCNEVLHNIESGEEGVLVSNRSANSPSVKFRSKDFGNVIELDAADLLAKYTHFCQVCGKGFKRDANLRMHMRAHGDEYKTIEALTNPSKKSHNEDDDPSGPISSRKYSCPQEGCRWNVKHAKFQPLKSMVCVKNHYRRSHCPKMYVCNRCNRKQFSVLSDLRTHEKHCGEQLRWRCSCGTTFSRKDKLMGHVSLFTGHAPAMN